MLHPRGHGGLPPIFLQVCGFDPLRDDALIYERVLRTEYNIPTKLILYPGLAHGFWAFLPKMEFSKQYQEDTVQGLAWLLSFVKS